MDVSIETKDSQAKDQVQAIESYFSLIGTKEEDKKILLQIIESLKAFESKTVIEEELNKNNAFNSNGIISSMKDLDKKKKDLDNHLGNAKANRLRVKHEWENISQMISCFVSIIQQEINFQCVCDLYRHLTQNPFTSESTICFEDEKSEKKVFTLNQLEDCVDSLNQSLYNKELDIKVIDKFIHILDEKMKIAFINRIDIYKYGVDRKFIDRIGPTDLIDHESEDQSQVEPSSVKGSRVEGRSEFEKNGNKNVENPGIVGKAMHTLSDIFNRNKDKK